jgi:Na+-transporting NADH:ubiquinone oxidoreductase subunit NqrA
MRKNIDLLEGDVILSLKEQCNGLCDKCYVKFKCYINGDKRIIVTREELSKMKYLRLDKVKWIKELYLEEIDSQ